MVFEKRIFQNIINNKKRKKCRIKKTFKFFKQMDNIANMNTNRNIKKDAGKYL